MTSRGRRWRRRRLSRRERWSQSWLVTSEMVREEIDYLLSHAYETIILTNHQTLLKITISSDRVLPFLEFLTAKEQFNKGL